MNVEHTGGTSPYNSPLTPIKELPAFSPLVKVKSFQVLEDKPDASPKHQDKQVQDAVKDAMLLLGSDGKKYLVFEE